MLPGKFERHVGSRRRGKHFFIISPFFVRLRIAEIPQRPPARIRHCQTHSRMPGIPQLGFSHRTSFEGIACASNLPKQEGGFFSRSIFAGIFLSYCSWSEGARKHLGHFCLLHCASCLLASTREASFNCLILRKDAGWGKGRLSEGDIGAAAGKISHKLFPLLLRPSLSGRHSIDRPSVGERRYWGSI